MAKSKLQTSNLRAVEVQESERPLYKVHRPAPAAHSNQLSVATTKSSSPFLGHPSRRNLRKDSQSKRGDEAAALDRLLAPEFRGDSFSGGRDSLDSPGGFSGSSRGGGGGGGVMGDGPEQRSGMGLGLGIGRKSSDRKSERSAGSGGGHRRLTNATSSSGKSRLHLGLSGGGGEGSGGLHRRNSYGRNNEPEEELLTKALGVYIDSAGRLHDKEYDPFENVRSMSRKKVERQRAFGAARSRDEDSEVGSDVSGSAVSGFGRLSGNGGFRSVSGGVTSGEYNSRASIAASDRYRGGGPDEAEVIRRKLMEERRGIEYSYSSGGILSDRLVTAGSRSWVADDDRFHQDGAEREQEEDVDEDDEFEDAAEFHQSNGTGDGETAPGGNRTRSNTKTSAGFSEYDSGYSAASPRMPSSEIPRSPAFSGGQAAGRAGSIMSPKLPSVSRLRQDEASGRNSPSTTINGQAQISSSAKTHASILSREERPRALLYPQTPAQAAAAEKRATLKAHTSGLPREDELAPPIAPFNPAFSGAKQGRNTSAPSSIRGVGGRRGSGAHTHASHSLHPPTHRKGSSIDISGATSSVFSPHEQGYLPSRWANGDKAFRAGEEEIDRYRPLEWSGSQNAQGPAEADFSPPVSEVVKRNWQELKLAFRFGAHRTKKKIERKVQMM